MAKHTPAPWTVNGRYVSALKEKRVCELPCGGVLHSKVDAANAQLVAAAPELLAACRQSLRRIEQLNIGTEELGDDPTVLLLKTVIAKAEGKVTRG